MAKNHTVKFRFDKLKPESASPAIQFEAFGFDVVRIREIRSERKDGPISTTYSFVAKSKKKFVVVVLYSLGEVIIVHESEVEN